MTDDSGSVIVAGEAAALWSHLGRHPAARSNDVQIAHIDAAAVRDT